MASKAKQAPKPRDTPKPSKTLNRAQAKAAADRKVLQGAIDRFDVKERERRNKLIGTRKQLVRVKGAANLKLRREALQIVRRMATLGFAADLLKAKVQAQLPPWMGGDPFAADPVIAKAVGNRTVALQTSYKNEVENLTAQATEVRPKPVPTMAKEAKVHQAKLGKYIIRRSSREMSPYAKSRAVKVLKRAVAKLPVSTFDGPLPAAELALFSLTVVDLYHQGEPLRRAAQMSVFNSAMEANNTELATATERAAGGLVEYDALQKRQNCASLASAFQRTPVPQLKAAVAYRCRRMG